jgi:hypothetical protein
MHHVFCHVLWISSYKYGVFGKFYKYPYCVLCNPGPAHALAVLQNLAPESSVDLANPVYQVLEELTVFRRCLHLTPSKAPAIATKQSAGGIGRLRKGALDCPATG